MLLLSLLACLTSQTVAQPSPESDPGTSATVEPARTTYMGREIAATMHYTGAGWLTRDSREREEEPALLMEALSSEVGGLSPGDTACDIGAGNGFYSLRLAEVVGPQGEVLATDIQPQMLRLLEDRAQQAGVGNVRTVLGGVADVGLEPGVCDLAVLVDVYHELSHPETMLAGMASALAPDGRLVLVEFRTEDPRIPIKRLHRMSKTQAVAELEANGFKLVAQDDRLPMQHVLAFEVAAGPSPAVEVVPWP